MDISENQMNKFSKFACPIGLIVSVVTLALSFIKSLSDLFTPICFFGFFAFFIGLTVDSKIKKTKDSIIWIIFTIVSIAIGTSAILLCWVY